MSVSDAAAVNPNCIKTPLANGSIKFPIKGDSVFNNDPTNLSKNPPGCSTFCNGVFDNFQKLYKALKLVY